MESSISWEDRTDRDKAVRFRTCRDLATLRGRSFPLSFSCIWGFDMTLSSSFPFRKDYKRNQMYSWCWTVGDVCPICHEWMILWSGCHRVSFGCRRISLTSLGKHWSDQVFSQESLCGCGIRVSLSDIDRRSLIMILMTASSIWKRCKETCDVFSA